MRVRLTVGHSPLEASIGVRIPDPQQKMKKYTLINKEAYDKLASEYKQRVVSSSKYKEPLDNLAGLSLKYAKQRFKKIDVLEIGPGNGEIARYFNDRSCSVVALDISKKILEVVNETAPKTKLVCADILDYKIPSGKFSLVYCGALIHLFKVEDVHKLMKKIWDGLKSNGILFVNTTIHNKSSEGFYIKEDYSGKIKRFRHQYTELEFRNLVAQGGFKVIDEKTTDEKDKKKFWLALICEKV